ncbi:hypothetical protein DPMN_011986 [Dreissena polymorpha]|uniref:Uncharacterized protein n=1 Tax=Dreissena polymorpha TaxID=45954 RepID=A0A9D4N652_DREPO|nr:hypothetical protein DPMN_011986 [Dreissena polymorpha]
MASCGTEFEKSFPLSTSRQRLFWEHQMSFAKKKDSRGVRWHPMIIRWWFTFDKTQKQRTMFSAKVDLSICH